MISADTTNVSGKTHESQISEWSSSWPQSREVSMSHESSGGRPDAPGYARGGSCENGGVVPASLRMCEGTNDRTCCDRHPEQFRSPSALTPAHGVGVSDQPGSNRV